MARKFLTPIDLTQNELRNVALQSLGSDPGSPVAAQVWFNSTRVRPVWYSGSVANDIYPSATANTANTNVLRDGSGNFSAGVGSFTSVTISGTPTNATDAATKGYADALVSGLDLKGSCRCATTGALSAYTFSATGGGTLTANANGAFPTQDTTVTLTVGQSILVKDETAGNAPYNGIYTLTQVGTVGTPWILLRRSDAAASASVTSGMYTFVSEGTLNGNNGYVLVTPDPITLNSTALSFTQFSGAGQIIAGTGLSKSGNTLSISATYAGQNTITTVGTIGTGAWQGTVVGNQWGGTGLNTAGATNGQLLIGNGTTGFTLATLTQGTGITITNAAGSITIAATAVAPLDGTFAVQNTADNTKQFKWLLSGQTASTILTIATAQSTSQTLNIPNITASDTVATLGLGQTYTGANTFSALPTVSFTRTDTAGATTPFVTVNGTIAPASASSANFYGVNTALTCATNSTIMGGASYIYYGTSSYAPTAAGTHSGFGGMRLVMTATSNGAWAVTMPVNYGLNLTYLYVANTSGGSCAPGSHYGIYVTTTTNISSGATCAFTSHYSLYLNGISNVGAVNATYANNYAIWQQDATATSVWNGFHTFNNTLTIADNKNIVLGTTNGTMFGTATSQKIGFFNKTPVAQLSGDVVTGLVNIGLFAAGATVSATSALDGTFSIKNTADNSKVLNFALTGMTTAKTLTFASAQTTTQTLNIPNITASDTLETLGLAQTITGAKTFTTSNLTITDVNIVLGTTTGTQIGTATTQKLGFYGKTAIVQPGAIDVATALLNLGLMATGGTYAVGALSGQVSIANGGTGLNSTSQNFVFVGPTSGAGAPSWRLLVAGDLPSTVAKNYSTNVGDGASLSYVITHNLGTLDIVAQVYEVSSGAKVECDIVRTSTTQITLTFVGTAPTSNQYRVTVHG